MIKAININTLEEVKFILDSLKPLDLYIGSLDENSYEYEDLCENVVEQFCEIEEKLIGKEKYNMTNVCKADIRIFSYWKYLRNELDFDELLEVLKENSNGLLLK